MTTINKVANRLAKEKSPYLLQHANNPVDWYPWGDEAFSKANAEDKPLFLSIGYSTCHWCHVMERESFEDNEVAELLNKHFVAVKVDREERPDIDQIYMTVCQAMTGQGGWPLTVVMTPEKKPFFAGTYFPKSGRGRMPGLMEILEQLSGLWKDERERVLASGDQVLDAVSPHFSANQPGELGEATLQQAYQELMSTFDPVFGGFNQAPKFPMAHTLSFLLRYWKIHHEEKALSMVEKTLESIYQGGIHDHIGGGYSRYATDRQWLVPHFEKMLYDNALLAVAFLETFQATKKEHYRNAAQDILDYVKNVMTSKEGGFYSAEDADSEGVEGKFYLWTLDEVRNILGDKKAGPFAIAFDITERGNFEGGSIPNLINNDADFWQASRSFQEEINSLMNQREKRIHPFKDDKILAGWNGLMIAAMAVAGRVLDDPSYTESAERAARFVLDKMRREDGRLLARYRDGEAAFPAYLDDYAYLVWGLLELYQTTFNPQYLKEAIELCRELLDLFWDGEKGGCFLSGKDGEELPGRTKEIYDGATPAGNSVTALNFLRLARLTGTPEWEEKAWAICRAFGGGVEDHPSAHSFLLIALLFATEPSRELVMAGEDAEKAARALHRITRTEFLPETVFLLAGPELEKLLPMIRDYRPVDHLPTAYLCSNFTCQAPTTDLESLRQALAGVSS